MIYLYKLYTYALALFFDAFNGRVKISKKACIHPLAVIDAEQGKITIGAGSVLHRGAMVMTYNGEITLGDNVSVNPYAILYGHGGLKIGNNVRIAAHVVIIPADHVFDEIDQLICKQGERRLGIIIEDDVWIAAGAKILDGSHIAKGCVIGANAVVKGRTEEYGVYVGVPARLIKKRC